MTTKELFLEARGITIFALSDFLKKTIDGIEGIDSQICTAAAAVAVIYAMAKNNDDEISPIVWEIIENILDKDNPEFLMLTRLRRAITPAVKSGRITVTNEIYKVLQEQAKIELETKPDATDDKRYHWKALVRGEITPDLIIDT